MVMMIASFGMVLAMLLVTAEGMTVASIGKGLKNRYCLFIDIARKGCYSET
jgi:hypothetical protein